MQSTKTRPQTRPQAPPQPAAKEKKFPVVIVVLAALMLLGLLGHQTTKGYHCHYIRVGDSIVCQ